MFGHIVLLGDSIFDNGGYVPGGPSVTEHLRRMLPDGWLATNLAVDGATVASVFRQIDSIPEDATHLVLSAGGNDALWTGGNIFALETVNVKEALQKLAESCEGFVEAYRQLVDELRMRNLPLTLCTVYDSVPGLDESDIAGLSVFNDAITRTAFSVGATLVDLRVICNEPTDYSTVSPIEPSAGGGGKIARAIMRAVSDDSMACRVIA